jgi:hypothetical protein
MQHIIHEIVSIFLNHPVHITLTIRQQCASERKNIANWNCVHLYESPCIMLTIRQQCASERKNIANLNCVHLSESPCITLTIRQQCASERKNIANWNCVNLSESPCITSYSVEGQSVGWSPSNNTEGSQKNVVSLIVNIFGTKWHVVTILARYYSVMFSHVSCECRATMAERLSFEQRKAVLKWYWKYENSKGVQLQCFVAKILTIKERVHFLDSFIVFSNIQMIPKKCTRSPRKNCNYMSLCSKDIDYQRVSTFFWALLYCLKATIQQIDLPRCMK